MTAEPEDHHAVSRSGASVLRCRSAACSVGLNRIERRPRLHIPVETGHGAPRYLRSDNGPEFASRAILDWIVTSNF